MAAAATVVVGAAVVVEAAATVEVVVPPPAVVSVPDRLVVEEVPVPWVEVRPEALDWLLPHAAAASTTTASTATTAATRRPRRPWSAAVRDVALDGFAVMGPSQRGSEATEPLLAAEAPGLHDPGRPLLYRPDPART
jgi:hypothetical protein